MFSDSHCGVALTIGSVYQSSSQAENMPTFSTPRLKPWKQENADLCLANFDSQKLSQINEVLNNLAQKPNVSKSDIDGVTCDIENIFHNACEGAFIYNTPRIRHVKTRIKGQTNHGLMQNVDWRGTRIIK